MTRQERIAALEAQLADSQKRRSALMGSLGKAKPVAETVAPAMEAWTSSPIPSMAYRASDAAFEYHSQHMQSPLPHKITLGRIERSDLSPSPALQESTGSGGTNVPADWMPLGDRKSTR